MAPVQRIALRMVSMTRLRAPMGKRRRRTRPPGCGAPAPPGVDLEAQLLALALQPVDAALQAHPIGLQPVTQAGLGDAVAGLELVGQAVEVVEQLRVEHGHVGGDHTPEQDAAEPGAGVTGRSRPPSATPSGDGPQVEHLQLGQDRHLRTASEHPTDAEPARAAT